LQSLATQAQIEEVLLISGDYPHALGPYSAVVEVLKDFPFADYGINSASLAGHPEGHPRVDLATIRQSERDKCQVARERGLNCRLVTQFFFEAAPFVSWSQDQITQHLAVDRIAGIAGPASINAVFKYALRCGVGPSLRALGVRPGSLLKLMGDYTPNDLVLSLATAKFHEPTLFEGLHVFCFGGLARTCRWLHALAQGQFDIDTDKGLRLHT
jgi:methylenetetrahydrofolate reductase (NADPH)